MMKMSKPLIHLISNKIQSLIESLKYKWNLIAPPHRLFILTTILGMVFTLSLATLINNRNKSSIQNETQPTDYGLVSERDMLFNTPLNLLFFSFKKIPPHIRRTCSHPVTLTDSNHLQDLFLNTPIPKGHFLCWSDIDQNSTTKQPKIRRGYRVIGFRISNPEIIRHIKVGHVIDANLYSESATSLNLKHLKIVDFLYNNNTITVLLELPKHQLIKIEKENAIYNTAQIILKNQSDPPKKTTRKKERGPKIHKG